MDLRISVGNMCFTMLLSILIEEGGEEISITSQFVSRMVALDISRSYPVIIRGNQIAR